MTSAAHSQIADRREMDQMRTGCAREFFPCMHIEDNSIQKSRFYDRGIAIDLNL
jgi:hypothetical protein